jgi:hypothetical protein
MARVPRLNRIRVGPQPYLHLACRIFGGAILRLVLVRLGVLVLHECYARPALNLRKVGTTFLSAAINSEGLKAEIGQRVALQALHCRPF